MLLNLFLTAILQLSQMLLLVRRHLLQKRRFPARCDFITGAGFLSGGQSRAESGVRGGGPQAVVTDLGLLEPDAQGELTLTALHPGCSVEQAQASTGWPLKVAGTLRTTQPPGEAELRLLREELDPGGIYLKSGG